MKAFIYFILWFEAYRVCIIKCEVYKRKHVSVLVSFCFSFFFWLRVLDKAEYSAFQSTLNSSIVSYRIVPSAVFRYTQERRLAVTAVSV